MALHPIAIPDVETSDGPHRTSNTTVWPASYALGLASARCRPASCIDDILDAARSDVNRLLDARRHLSSVSVVDEDLRASAHALLSTAIASLQVETNEHAHG